MADKNLVVKKGIEVSETGIFGGNLSTLGNLNVSGTTTGVTKTMVGLGNVDNTTDLLKPISTATQTALNAKVTKVTTSTDNALVRFDSTTGDVQNSLVTVDDSGNVGIGVTPSAWDSGNKALQVGSVSTLWNIANYTILSNNEYTNGGQNKYVTSDFASRYAQQGGVHSWLTAPFGATGNTIPFTHTMTLNTSGNLLIGKTTDDGINKLQVNGCIRANGSKISALVGIDCGGDITTWYNLIEIQAAYSKFQVATSENNYIQFWDISYAAVTDSLAYSKAPDVGHTHTSDFTFRVSNNYLQCKNVLHTSHRQAWVINILTIN